MGAISTLPPAPSRSDSADIFIAKADALIAALGQLVTETNAVVDAFNNNATNATSSTSLAVGTGTKSLTASTGKSYVPGQTLKVAYTTTPTTWMVGDVISYNSVTGGLILSIVGTSGSGTFATWTISLAPFSYPVSTYIQTLLDDIDAVTAKATLDLNPTIFKGIKSTFQSLTTGVPTKLTSFTEVADVKGWYASDRFTPLVAGWYLIQGGVILQGTAVTQASCDFYLNGSQVQRCNDIILTSGNASQFTTSGLALLYFNGSTDYIELYATVVGTSPSVTSGNFWGIYIRP